MKIKNAASRFGYGYLLFAVLLFALGVCLIAFKNALDNAALAIGICLSAFAIVYGVLTLADKNRGVKFFLRIIFSAVALICGVTTIITRNGAIEVIVTVFSLLLLLDGAFKFQTTVLAKRIRSPFWTVMLVLSVVIIGGAFAMIKFYPADLPRVIALGTAGIMIVDGAANLLTPFYLIAIERASIAPAASESAVESAPEAGAEPPAKKEKFSLFGNKEIKEVKAFAKSQGYAGAKAQGEWNGFKVYQPTFKGKGVHYVGLPLVILVRDGEIRMSTDGEAMDYLHATIEKTEE